MILAKLMPTLKTSMAPAATRSAAISALAPRPTKSRMGLIFGGGGAHRLQHVVHGRLVLGQGVADRIEQRLHLREVIGGQHMHRAAGRGPITLELFGEV